MKKNILFLLICIISFSSCKENKINFEYQFSDKPDLFACSEVEMDLIKEAVYSFDKDLLKAFENKGVSNIPHAYSMLLSLLDTNKIDINSLTSKHTNLVFNKLQNNNSLWLLSKGEFNLNNNSSLVNCIGKSIKNKDIKTTFNSLIETNSMSNSLFRTVIYDTISEISSDLSLKTFIVLSYFCTDFYKKNNND